MYILIVMSCVFGSPTKCATRQFEDKGGVAYCEQQIISVMKPFVAAHPEFYGQYDCVATDGGRTGYFGEKQSLIPGSKKP